MISENSIMPIQLNEEDVVKIPENIPDAEFEEYDFMDDKERIYEDVLDFIEE